MTTTTGEADDDDTALKQYLKAQQHVLSPLRGGAQAFNPTHGAASPFQPRFSPAGPTLHAHSQAPQHGRVAWHWLPEEQHDRKDSAAISPAPFSQHSLAAQPPAAVSLTLEQRTIAFRYGRTKAKLDVPCLKCLEDGFLEASRTHPMVQCHFVDDHQRRKIEKDWDELKDYGPLLETWPESEDSSGGKVDEEPEPEPRPSTPPELRYLSSSDSIIAYIQSERERRLEERENEREQSRALGQKPPPRPDRQNKKRSAAGQGQGQGSQHIAPSSAAPSFMATWVPSSRPTGSPPSSCADGAPLKRTPVKGAPKGPRGWNEAESAEKAARAPTPKSAVSSRGTPKTTTPPPRAAHARGDSWAKIAARKAPAEKKVDVSPRKKLGAHEAKDPWEIGEGPKGIGGWKSS